MKRTVKPRIVIQFAVTAREKRKIQRAAKRDGLSLSDWLRRVADAHIAEMRAQAIVSADRKYVGLLP